MSVGHQLEDIQLSRLAVGHLGAATRLVGVTNGCRIALGGRIIIIDEVAWVA